MFDHVLNITPPPPSFFLSSVEDLEQQRKQDSDSGVGSDSGDKRLSATEVLLVNVVSYWVYPAATTTVIIIIISCIIIIIIIYSHQMKTAPV